MTYALLILTASLSVSTADLTLHDAARNRDIPVKIYYSSSTQPAPLIVFSHGYGGNMDGYSYLGEAWATAGFIVICPTHKGSDRDAILHSGSEPLRDPAESFALQADRTSDVKFILSSLGTVESSIPELRGKIDKGRIGVGGHSMGAGTAMLLAGATAMSPEGRRTSFRDSRVKAIVAMSPQGSSEEGFDQHSWDDIHIPVMVMSGTRDRGVGGQSPEWRQEAYNRMPPGEKYEVIVDGAGHLAFAIGKRFHDCIAAESTAFWKKELLGSAAAIQSTRQCQVNSK